MQFLRLFRALLTGMALFAAAAASHAQTAVVLRGARVIDGAGGDLLDNSAIVIRDGRIAAIGPAQSTTTPADAETIDYSGKTIIPGLISAHSHVGIFAGLSAAPENYNRDFILQQLKQLEAYGVTTIMSLGLNGPLFYELRAGKTGRGQLGAQLVEQRTIETERHDRRDAVGLELTAWKW